MITTALTGLCVALGIQLITWLISIKQQRVAIVDLAWTASIGILTAVYFVMGEGHILHKLVALLLIGTWCLRLTVFLFVTRISAGGEDARYRTLRDEWGAIASVRFFMFYMVQGVLGFIFSIPALILTYTELPELTILEYFGIVLFIVSLIGETIADLELYTFKEDQSHKGRTCRVGLWSYSRHPNYFFEWMIWVSLAIVTIELPYGWLSIICPALMLFFLWKVSGIPAAEQQALKSRGDDYRSYQKTTSVFVPWFRKKDRTS